MQDVNIEARKLQLTALKAYTVLFESINQLAALRGITTKEAQKEVENLVKTMSVPPVDPDPQNKILDEGEESTKIP